jgi:alpha-tubulin suppressor-like RCC1 family protein
VVELAAGAFHTCALLVTGAVRCWGDNGYGQLGYGHTFSIGDNELPSSTGDVQVGGTVVKLTAGKHHTCALLSSGAARCWGRNSYGQLGYGHTNFIGDNELPSSAGDVPVGGALVSIDAGSLYTCALLSSGAARCWGHNNHGQLGHGHTNDIGDNELPSSAGDIAVGGPARQLIAGFDHTCALLTTGDVRCWGNNSGGQLGHGHTIDIGDNELPSSAGNAAIGGLVNRLAPSLGGHTCAEMAAGEVRCWGYALFGQLGYGHTNHIGDDEPPSSAGPVPYL